MPGCLQPPSASGPAAEGEATLPLAPVFLMAHQVAALSNPALGQHSHRATGHTLQLLLAVTDLF